MSNSSSKSAAPIVLRDRTTTDRLRTVIELSVCLTILVSLFRTFLAGGYMIETGSMAPCLVGYHRQVTCPSCRFPFAAEGNSTTIKAVCPNCGQGGISVERLPRNDGDHLLVHRAMYEFRAPRRWEVIVFRNPNKPTQAYVKRLIGLPGELLQIEGGDILVSGKIQTKNYATQRGMRISVYDHDFQPAADEADWQPRWVADQAGGNWQAAGSTFRYRPRKKDHGEAENSQAENPDGQVAWVHYRHWIRHGGMHLTSVPLAECPESLARGPSGFGALRYDADEKMLVCRGALSAEQRVQLLADVQDADARQSVERLYEASHIAPIVDNYGYNWGRDGHGQHEVRDLMLSAQVRLPDGPGEFVLAITDGSEEFQCIFDAARRQVRLIDVRTGKALKTGALNEHILAGPVCVEISLMDRQVLLAVEGKLVFEPYSYTATRERGPTPWQPVGFGVRGFADGGSTAGESAVEIRALKLFRDVYYTDDGGRRAVDGPLQLKPDEFFVLGDNSPVSKDSRSWSKTTVLTAEMLLGKPLAVHLPSKKRQIQIGDWQTEIRIPEISRIRYIH
jgi:signal peptidase I